MRKVLLSGGWLLLFAGIMVILCMIGLFVEQKQTINGLKTYRQEMNMVMRALNDNSQSLKNLPSVADIEPQKKDAARKYVQNVRGAAPSVNVLVPEPPEYPLFISFNPSIQKFKSLTHSPDYQQASGQSRQAFEQAKDFIAYHAAVMQALSSVVEYQPAVDTNSNNAIIITQNLEAAELGLQKTIEKLKQVPAFDDSSIEELKSLINRIEPSRAQYEQLSRDGKRDEAARQKYIDTIKEVQTAILKNRQAFWDKNFPQLINNMEQARTLLEPFNTQLQNI